VLRTLREQALHFDGAPGDLISEWEVFERRSLPPEMHVFGTGARAEQDLQVDNRACADQAPLNVPVHRRPDGRLAHS
jgi:hypothetical protein